MSNLAVIAQVNIPIVEAVGEDNIKLSMTLSTMSTGQARVIHTPDVYSKLFILGEGHYDRIPGTHYQDWKEVITFNNAQVTQSSGPDDCVSKTNQTTAGLAYYTNSVDKIDIIYAIGWGGKEVNPVITFSKETQQLISNIAFDGAIYVQYRIAYYFIDYYPKITTLQGGGTQADWGILFAYYKAAKASLDFPQLQFDSPHEFEVCEVYWEYVADADGAWEKPKDWPDDPYYDSGDDPPEPDGAQLLEKQERIWFVSPLIGLTFKDLNPRTLQPYESSPSYKPEYKFRIHSPPNEEWALNEYNKINFQAIKKEVYIKYGITF